MAGGREQHHRQRAASPLSPHRVWSRRCRSRRPPDRSRSQIASAIKLDATGRSWMQQRGSGHVSCGSTSLARPMLGLGGEHLLPMQARKGPPSATVALVARSTSLLRPHLTPAFVLARVFPANGARTAAYVRKRKSRSLRERSPRLPLVRGSRSVLWLQLQVPRRSVVGGRSSHGRVVRVR